MHAWDISNVCLLPGQTIQQRPHKLRQDLVHMGTSVPVFKSYFDFRKSEKSDVANYLSRKQANHHLQIFCI
jgi:hypothetical protein